ncbi:DEAD/DEAH box helicase [Streptomyces radiopugnans]|uniref:Helicase associated domain-containing protein n=2 Tax=Streptomyces radiopugnans TaxID=403935 RepID=A0A1H9DBH3_9ACTN|nr:DEAD/DEAH box helicase [Streptomyces radiopugnans]SEQ10711.1 Helicase associated domain-containing protein [Streptomyces radiopugnans]SEQ98130.1 Helicase associated domain-containing protein [Streptomyces radiopugnans]
MGSIRLRPHQVEAVDAIVRALEYRAGRDVPAEGLRATAVAATGAGKTLIAAEAARRLEPRGRVLVMVPTLDLLSQTVEAWRMAGHTGPAVAVCSLEGDEALEALGVRCTTNAIRLALWAGSGPVTVFATYASLAPRQEPGPADPDEAMVGVPGPLEAALQGAYGQQLEPFGLAVVDEAHRTSGDLAKPWAAIHDNRRIPAARRLYLTATPRIWEPAGRTGEAEATEGENGAQEAAEDRSEAAPAVPGKLVASMDDERLYGPHVFTFSLTEAIDRGILARFEIDVLEIRPPDLSVGGSEEERRGRRLAALQAALVKHAAETGVRSLISFHHRTVEAMSFARALPQTAARLHEEDPATYPRRVWADWLCGEHEPAHRRAVLGRFADGVDEQGWETELAVLANVRVLGEGVDITGRRGVDGVLFADVRGSAVDIVQAVGRALRQKPGQGKVARLVVPVFLEPGEAPDDMLASASYKPLVAVLQGLRSHSEAVVEQLAVASAPSRGRPASVAGLDPAGGGGGGEGGDEGALEEVPLLRFSTPRDPQLVAQFVRTRVIRPESQVWLAGLNALRTWRQQQNGDRDEDFEHGGEHEGQEQEREQGGGAGRAARPVAVPLDARVGTFPLGAWTSEQRRAYRAGTLAKWRVELLEEAGMVWSVPDAAFEENLAAARAYYAVHGTLCAPRTAVAQGRPIGQWLTNCRRPGGLGKDPERAAERAARLAEIDPDWNPAENGWTVDWQRHYAKLWACLHSGATLAEIRPGVTVGGEDIGLWLARQRTQWEQLADGQRERLAALGIQPTAAAPGGQASTGDQAAGTVVVPAGASAWDRALAALRQYQAREGHVRVPRKWIETFHDQAGHQHPIRLGVWINNQRQRRDRLDAERAKALEELGVL